MFLLTNHSNYTLSPNQAKQQVVIVYIAYKLNIARYKPSPLSCDHLTELNKQNNLELVWEGNKQPLIGLKSLYK